MSVTASRRPRRGEYPRNGYLRALVPEAPAERTVGPRAAAPVNGGRPYRHKGGRIEDFCFRCGEGRVARIRAAYVSGSPPQHAHAPFPRALGPDDRLWLTVRLWSGEVNHAAWALR